MSDLLTMQPNINIDLFLVAPDARYTKFKREVPRATFASRRNPLHKVCGFIPYTSLCEMLDRLADYLDNLKPDFVKKVAVYYDPQRTMCPELHGGRPERKWLWQLDLRRCNGGF